jgi:hypothetical protein
MSQPEEPTPPPLGRAPAALAGVIALALLAPMLAAALTNMSRAWDVGYYHLPFAARLGGVLGPGDYVFHRMNQARFEGFPLLAERLQGVCWRLTGRPEATNLVALACVPLFAWFLRARFRVPLGLSVIALLAIPLVHVHATSSYVDVPANAAASVVVLLAIDAWAREAELDGRTVALAIGCAAIAADIKFQTYPVLLVALAALGARLVVPLRRGAADAKARARRLAIALVAAMPLVFAAPIDNVVRHHNPFYPVELRVAGHVLPGADTPYAASPAWLEHAPRPVRFAASLLELRIRPFSSTRRWTVDQWMDDDDGSRVGGFFNAYVVVLLAMLAALVVRARGDRRARAVGAGFALLTAVTSVLPQSHELRYYLDWMIVLVACVLWLACAPREAAKARGARIADALTGPRAALVVALAALSVVLAVTRCGYAYPSGTSFAGLVAEEVPPAAIAGVADGERVCTKREPWAILWAAKFHGRRYVLKEAQEKGDCDGFRPLD